MSSVQAEKKKKGIQISRSDCIFYIVIGMLLSAVFIVILYPLIFIMSASFSSSKAIISGRVIFLPVDFSAAGYRAVFRYRGILQGMLNSALYVLLGTSINVAVTICCGYGMAQKRLPFRNVLTFIFTFTMFFSGGLIPAYLNMKNLGLLNTRWAVILPGAMSVYNMILTRTYIQNSIPHELQEAAFIDGSDDFKYFFRIVIPLSKPILAVITLYYAVGHWNGWFDAFLYLRDRELHPLQLIIREVLTQQQVSMESMVDSAVDLTDSASEASLVGMQELMKYAMIVITSVPPMILYPFIQKFFEKGIMIGSVKG